MRRPSPSTKRQNLAPLGAQSHAHSDLLAALANQIGEHPVNADAGQQ